MQAYFWRANAQYFFAKCVASILNFKQRKVGERKKFLPRGRPDRRNPITSEKISQHDLTFTLATRDVHLSLTRSSRKFHVSSMRAFREFYAGVTRGQRMLDASLSSTSLITRAHTSSLRSPCETQNSDNLCSAG